MPFVSSPFAGKRRHLVGLGFKPALHLRRHATSSWSPFLGFASELQSCPQTDPATAISVRTLHAERAENLVGRQPMKSGFANAFAHDEFYFAPGDFFVDFHCLNQILW